MDLLLITGVVAVSLFAWLTLFKIIPDCLLSMFRYRLWRQRDELAAEIRNGGYRNDQPARQLLLRIECYIRIAPQLSPLHIALMRLSMMGVEQEPWLDLRGVTGSELRKLELRLHDLARTLGNHVLFETPTGWGVVLMASPLWALMWVYRRIGRDGTGTRRRSLESALRRASEAASELANRVRAKGLTSQHV